MRLIEFPEKTVVVAKDQPQYQPMPAYRFEDDAEGKLVCCWHIPFWERVRLLFTGKLWHVLMTFGQPIQPQLLLVDKPHMPPHNAKVVQLGAATCAQCKETFPPADKWVLVQNNGTLASRREFCSQQCAEVFSSTCIGILPAKACNAASPAS